MDPNPSLMNESPTLQLPIFRMNKTIIDDGHDELHSIPESLLPYPTPTIMVMILSIFDHTRVEVHSTGSIASVETFVELL